MPGVSMKMRATDHIRYECSRESYRPACSDTVRWLDRERDWPLVQAFWRSIGFTATKADWLQAHDDGYEYCAAIDGGEITADAAVWRYSPEAWEVAAVYTRGDKRRRGLGKAVVSLVTQHILAWGRIATCGMRRGNLAMARTAESVGFTECER